jgi:hypothetical protein
MAELVKYEIEMCALDKNGKVIVHKAARPPYGYHFINKVYADGSKWTEATVSCERSIEEVGAIAKILANDLRISMIQYGELKK